MLRYLPEQLKRLASTLEYPLYVVGGAVRDALTGNMGSFNDWDICAPVSAEAFVNSVIKQGFTVHSVYKNTGTVKLSDCNGVEYEFASFRSDEYVRGEHTPAKIFFTNDIKKDALRRDFTVNAVYYDVKTGEFVDPLLGIPDVKNKLLRTVREGNKVFSEDGLRLLRLARFAGSLGFAVEENTLLGAKNNCSLIRDIVPERVFEELVSILHADARYGVKDGAYRGLCILRDTGVLAEILPELALGDKMAQRADFHKYDVLEHSLRAVLYAQPSIRLSALLHDVGKPACKLKFGNVYDHPVVGEALACSVLERFKAPKKVTERVCLLVKYHMYDMDLKTSENKVRRFIVENYELLDDLFALKQADYSACADDLTTAPTVARWRGIIEKMRLEGVPFTMRSLAVTGQDLVAVGLTGERIGKTLHALFLHTAVSPQDNNKERLLKLAVGLSKENINAKRQ